MTITCPVCNALTIKKNGHIHNGKQNHECLAYGRQFVRDPAKKEIDISRRKKAQIKCG